SKNSVIGHGPGRGFGESGWPRSSFYEIHDIRRFTSAGQLLSCARLVRCDHESAGKVVGCGGKKIGNAQLRWAADANPGRPSLPRQRIRPRPIDLSHPPPGGARGVTKAVWPLPGKDLLRFPGRDTNPRPSPRDTNPR